MKYILSSILLLLFSFRVNAQCSLRKITLASKIENATYIIEGKVIDQSCFFNESKTFIYTKHTIEVYKLFKGDKSVDTIEIITEGGVLENRKITVNPSVRLKTGDIGMFLLIPSKVKPTATSTSNTFELYSGIQGFIKYDLNNHTASVPFAKYTDIEQELYKPIGEKLRIPIRILANLTRDTISYSIEQRATPLIINFTPVSITAGTQSVLTINGAGFGDDRGSSAIAFHNADDAGESYIFPYDHQYLFWSDTQIKVEVPSNAGTGTIQINTNLTSESVTELIIPYAQLNVDYNDSAFTTRLVTINDQEGISWRFSKQFDANIAAKEAFIRALEKWTCQSYINWKIGPVIDVDTLGNDELNVVLFDKLSEGTLAACYNYWIFCDSVWIVAEMDMIIGNISNWQFGPDYPSTNQFDFESIILHELGHGHQLGHVINSADLMHYSIMPGELKRDIGLHNIACANDVMDKSTTNDEVCSFYSMMTPLNSSNCDELYAINTSDAFKVFPNPSNGFFNLGIPNKTQNLSIKCYSAYGNLVKSITATNVSSFVPIDLYDLSQGIYLLVINNGEQTVTQKVVIAFTK